MTMKCDFSIPHYREILQAGLRNGYRFVGYDEMAQLSPGQKACVMRHDVDYMPEWSMWMGEAESELGIQSTYFFQIGANTYNLRDPKNLSTLKKLREMGHAVGLHLDLSPYGKLKQDEIVSLAREDKYVFQAITGIEPCEFISFHNPRHSVDLIFNKDVPGMRHSYEERFFSAIKYLSDSQGWYEGCMCKVFESNKYDRIQLLTHPYIWPGNTASEFINDIASMIKLRSEELIQYLVDYHPVCAKHEARLRETVDGLFSGYDSE